MQRSHVWFVVLVVMASMVGGSATTWAKNDYHVEVLQVSKVNAFDWLYQGFVDELARNGLVEGQNLRINRRIIDADAEAGLWKKLGILRRIKRNAGEIVKTEPDLVLTISTPATKYSKDSFIKAGIPVVFSGVAIPGAVGCASMSQGGPGFTGASVYIDPLDALKITKLALPDLEKFAIIHSDDDNAIAFVAEATAKARRLGITILSKQVEKSDNPRAAAEELLAQGAQAFGVPIDVYYALRNYQPTEELLAVITPHNIPTICFCHIGFSGGILYIGSEFGKNGTYSGDQAARILCQGARPEELPIRVQEELKVMVDLDTAASLGIELPLEILQIAKTVHSERK